MKTKAIVTGGLGFIGQNLVKALLDKGWDVHVVDNLANSNIDSLVAGASLMLLDIRHRADLIEYFQTVKPDYVFHLAALPRVQFSIEDPVQTHNVNVTGTMNVLFASKAAGSVKKVVFSSSSSIYGDQKVMPLVETMTPNPLSPYGAHKLIGEIYCKLWDVVYDLPTISLRYFNVYGEHQNDEGAYALVIAKFFKQKAEGKPLTITGDGTQTRDFTNVSDVVHANILAAESDIRGGEIFNIGYGSNASVAKVAYLIGGPVEYVEARLEPHDTLADNTKAEKILGWCPQVSIETGIEILKVESATA
jgi:UDP-glucose 4-epimerase